MKYRTRKSKLLNKLTSELETPRPSEEQLIKIFEEFESDNIKTIEKLRRKQKPTINKINGALKQTINAHGPITKDLIGSASKRIYGSILELGEEEKTKCNGRLILLITFILTTILNLSIFYLFF